MRLGGRPGLRAAAWTSTATVRRFMGALDARAKPMPLRAVKASRRGGADHSRRSEPVEWVANGPVRKQREIYPG